MTQLEFTNAALALIGETPITAIDQAVPRAERASVLFAPLLRRFLREHTWNWAKTRATLDPESPGPAFEWSHRFAMPEDLVTLIQVNGTCCGPSTVGELYEIEGRYILADSDEAEIQYIYYPSDSQLADFLEGMDALAADVFTVLFASKLANPLARDSAELGRALYQQYVTVDLSRARTKDAGEQKMPAYNGARDSNVIRSRYTRGAGPTSWG